MEENENVEVIPGSEEGETPEEETQVETPEVGTLQKELEEARGEAAEAKTRAAEQERLASKHANRAHDAESKLGAVTRLEHAVGLIASELGIELPKVETPKPEGQATEDTQAEDPVIGAFLELLEANKIDSNDPEMRKVIEGKTPIAALMSMMSHLNEKQIATLVAQNAESNRLEVQKQLKSHGFTAVELGGPTAQGETSEKERLKQRYPSMHK